MIIIKIVIQMKEGDILLALFIHVFLKLFILKY